MQEVPRIVSAGVSGYSTDEVDLRNDDEGSTVASKEALLELKRIQSEYMQSSRFHECEDLCRKKLEELARSTKFETDAPVLLKTELLSTSFRNLSKSYLVSDLVVVGIDTAGNVSSKPLRRLPQATIMAVVQESTPQLKDLISGRRESMALTIASLEELVRKLKMSEEKISLSESGELESPEPKAQPRPTIPRELAQEKEARSDKESVEQAVEMKPRGFSFLGVFKDSSSQAPRESYEKKSQPESPKTGSQANRSAMSSQADSIQTITST